ncbi:MAG: hypothetical protein ACJ8BF_10245 [Gemmatimonadales bacterium]
MIVELVGPAGVGKSTLNRQLTETWSARSGTIWGLPRRRLLRNGVQLIPSFMPLWRLADTTLWDETTHMVRLRTLQQLLREEKPGELLVFDEGPVFALTWLRGFGHPIMRSLAADPWWQTALRNWAGLMDAIVVLDAPDPLLAQRIRSRAYGHEVKRASDREVAVWMGRFREALDWVIAELTKQPGPLVVRLETAAAEPAQIAQRVLEALDRGAYAG